MLTAIIIAAIVVVLLLIVLAVVLPRARRARQREHTIAAESHLREARVHSARADKEAAEAEEMAARARRERAEVEERAAAAENEANERLGHASRERAHADGLTEQAHKLAPHLRREGVREDGAHRAEGVVEQ